MLAQANCRELPLAANSVSMIFADPPYAREYLPCYGWLAREAKRVLKPGGFVLAYCGNLHLNKIVRMFDDAGLNFFLPLVHKSNGDAPVLYTGNTHAGGVPVLARSKIILTYCKGPGRLRVGGLMTLYDNHKADKRYHHWGQSVAEARYFIDHFSGPGDIVVDPFLGGGTTAIACELIGRRCLGFDMDPVALATSAARLAQADVLHTLPLFAQEPA